MGDAQMTPERVWIDEDTWYAGPGRTERAVEYVRADLYDTPETGGWGMNAPEWKHMTDWSDLPDLYVTKVECQQGMFWRVEACSVPMAIGPECRLVRADLFDAEHEARVAAEAERDAALAAAKERENG